MYRVLWPICQFLKVNVAPDPKSLPTPALKGGLVPAKLQLTMHSDWNDYVKKKSVRHIFIRTGV